MASSPKPAPLGLYSLSEADQKQKLRKRQQIEEHWQCSLEKALPKAIRPRLTATKVKAKVGHQIPEAEWWRWSVNFFYDLEHLAAMTPGRLPFAQALMQAEVAQRQQDYSNTRRNNAELLKSDLTRIIAELKERTNGGYNMDEDYDDEDSGDDADIPDEEETSLAGPSGNAAGSEIMAGVSGVGLSIKDQSFKDEDTTDRPIKLDPDEAPPVKRKATDVSDIPAAKRRSDGSSSQTRASKETLDSRANIAGLRAAAARLRQQASQREAKAYKLEAELYEKEAGEAE